MQKLKIQGFIIDQYIIENEIITERQLNNDLEITFKKHKGTKRPCYE